MSIDSKCFYKLNKRGKELRIAIIGASHAGISAATEAKKRYSDAEIVLYEKKNQISFISQNTLFYILDQDRLRLDSGQYTTVVALRNAGYIVNTSVDVQSIDGKEHVLSYINLENGMSYTEHWDKLIMAIGSYPVLPIILGPEPDNLFVLKDLKSALDLNRVVKKGKTAVIFGSGSIGVELARILKKRGLKVVLVEKHDKIMTHYFDHGASDQLEEILKSEGIEVRKNEMAVSFEKAKKHIKTKTSSGEILTDIVIFSAGFRPNVALLRNQVEIGKSGAIKTDRYLQTSLKDVFAIGDCAETYCDLLDQGVYVPHASDALRTGQIVISNLIEPRKEIMSSEMTLSIDMDDLIIATTGITFEKSVAAGYKAAQIFYHNAKVHKMGYNIWLTYDQETHKILGAQFVGDVPNINSYVNSLSIAITNHMTTDEFADTDFYFEHGFQDVRGIQRIIAELIYEKEER